MADPAKQKAKTVRTAHFQQQPHSAEAAADRGYQAAQTFQVSQADPAAEQAAQTTKLAEPDNKQISLYQEQDSATGEADQHPGVILLADLE